MRDIASILNLRRVEGDVGVEIEIEGINLPLKVAGWRRDNDPSLRGVESAEYVLAKPVPLADLQKAFDNLKEAFKGAKIDQSYRAGVHVHVNVQDISVTKLFNFITLFLIMEESLVDFCEQSRRGNHFCLRAKDAGYFTHLLWQACKKGNLALLKEEDIRYSAMNITSLFQYGSVEFRSLESTTDFNKIMTWCLMLHKLKEAALRYKSPIEIMESVSGGGFSFFVSDVMGEYAPIIKGQDGWEKKVREGILNAQDLAYSRKWSSVNLNIFKQDKEVF